MIDELKELRNYHVNRLILSPKQWSQYCVDIDLNWEIVKFDKKNKNLIPNNQSGVYTFVIKPNIANHPECAYLMYVGKTERQTFRDRFMQYFRERKKGRPRIKAMLALWPNNIW
ncbi:MAG: hypothetical protein N2385_08680, partial [Chloroflexus sp.]|nr:hypothetical protein [Chloroflexus sp.]